MKAVFKSVDNDNPNAHSEFCTHLDLTWVEGRDIFVHEEPDIRRRVGTRVYLTYALAEKIYEALKPIVLRECERRSCCVNIRGFCKCRGQVGDYDADNYLKCKLRQPKEKQKK